MDKIRVSAVSYTNSIPFVEGIKQSDEVLEQIDLTLDIPLDCAYKMIHNQADIGLIPVAAIPFVKNAQIISDYCIGSNGPVNSVFILSNKPIQAVDVLKLDPQSRTSNNLSKILLKYHWKVYPSFVGEEFEFSDAKVLIGDRTFGVIDQYPFVYDLGLAWKEFTGLPFVFAAWVSSKELTADFVQTFNTALKAGVDMRAEIASELTPVRNFDLQDYLVNKLDYNLDSEKRKAIDLYLRYLKEFI